MTTPGKELLFLALGGSGEIGMNANLYGCDLSDASLVGADLTQALLDKTLFGMPADAP